MRHPSVFLTIHAKLLYYLLHWIPEGSQGDEAHLRLDEILFSMGRMPVESTRQDLCSTIRELLESDVDLRLLSELAPEQRIAHLWLKVYRALSGRAKVIGDKYNEYVLHLPYIHKCFPNARYIFIHREPFATSFSMLTSFRDRIWCPPSIEAALSKWTRWVEAWNLFRPTIHRSRYIEIDYDSLTQDPEQTMRRICLFLSLDAPSKYLELCRSMITHSAFEDCLTVFNPAALRAEQFRELQRLAAEFGYDLRSHAEVAYD